MQLKDKKNEKEKKENPDCLISAIQIKPKKGSDPVTKYAFLRCVSSLSRRFKEIGGERERERE